MSVCVVEFSQKNLAKAIQSASQQFILGTYNSFSLKKKLFSQYYSNYKKRFYLLASLEIAYVFRAKKA